MKKLTTLLSVIATIAITWYVCTYYSAFNNWWSLPLIAGINAIFAVFLPILVTRFKPFWSIISTGLTLLVLQTSTNVFTLSSTTKFTWLLTTFFVIGIITELLAHGISVIHLGELLLDFAISIAFSWIVVTISHPIITLVFLLIGHVLVLIFDFNCKFSLKGKKSFDDEDEEREDYIE